MIIKWFKNKVINWARSDRNTNSDKAELVCSTETVRRIDQNGMNFTIYQANGGHVMEYSSYNRKNDTRDTALHIISSDQDLGQGIAHIITFEMLRK